MNSKITAHIAHFFLAISLLAIAASARAAFHEWKINEVYSNHSGTVQFVELTTTQSGQEFLINHTITCTQGGTTRTFTFPSNLAAGTANKKFLIATPAFAALGIVTPDYVMPEGFLFTANATVNFSGFDSVTYIALPTDGTQSINASGVASVNSPTNYAGVTGLISIAPPATLNNFLGANLNGIADFRRNHEYVDVMRQSRPFGTATDPFDTVIAVGADGWPTGDFGVTLMAAQTGVTGIAGTYKGIFTGGSPTTTVTSAASGAVSNVVFSAGTNTTTFDIVLSAAQPTETMALRFQAVPPGNPVKNLRIIRPGFSTTSPPTFTPAYLNHVSRFKVLRFMDWLSTNEKANSIVSWADRPTLEKKRTEAEGARWEAVVELANTVNRDIWITIPVRANDEYVTNLAIQLRDTLIPSVNVYVEYSNELWNGAFPQFAIQKQFAINEVTANPNSPLKYDGSNDQNVWAFRRVAKRLKEISDIFKTVWGPSAINTRVRPVLAGQMANSFIVTEGIDLVDVGLNVRPNTVFYAISGAPYIFPSANNQASDDEVPGLTAAQLLAAIGTGVNNAPNANSYLYESHLALAAWHGLKVLAYEGGFDTFGNQNIAAKRTANLDPQIRTHCRNLLNRWHAFGFETFVYFNAGADNYNIQFGQWPLLEDIQDTVFPKNQCMDDVLGAAVPALTSGMSVATLVPGGAFIGSASPTGTISNTSGPFGFPGFAQYLLRVDKAGTYQLRFTSTGSATPKVGVRLNGVTINSAFLLPSSASFVSSTAIPVTLRKGINALRLTRPPDASTWTIQSLAFAAPCGGGVGGGICSLIGAFYLMLLDE